MEFFCFIEECVKQSKNTDKNLTDRFKKLFNGNKHEITRCPEVNFEKTRKEEFN